MSDFPPAFYRTIRALDRFADLSGKLISLSMLYLVATICYECFARYCSTHPPYGCSNRAT
jgi:TRAP-type mannitol/chloroaromatic compound transport system permease small subunit